MFYFCATNINKKRDILSMKKIFNILFVITCLALAFICYRSIMGPIQFNEERDRREQFVIQKLVDIRTAQIEYRSAYGKYTDNIDTLIEFVKTAQLPMVLKEGELNDAQLDKGITEDKALEMIRKAEKSGKWKEVDEAGIRNFRRDTVWIPLKDTVFTKTFNADSMRYVPFGKGTQFEMAVSKDTAKSGGYMYLFEAKTPYTVYLQDINEQELKNLISEQEKLDRYCGLKVGDVENANNNAGNWE